MAKQAVIKVSGKKINETVVQFLKLILEKGLVEALLIPRALPTGDGFVQTLIRNITNLNNVTIFSPTMPVQSARILSNLSIKNLNKKVAVVLKPCEIRAVIELTKFLQIKLENLYLIGIDCPGTFEVSDYANMVKEGKNWGELELELIKSMEKGDVFSPMGYHFRDACQMCEYPVAKADIMIKLFGYHIEDEIGIEIEDRLEVEFEKNGITLQEAGEPSYRKEVVNKIISQRTNKRDKVFKEFKERVKDLQSFLDLFSTCIRCHNCMVACPICYCKECVFRTAIFEHEGDQFLRWADRKGSIRMPTDTLIFHLIRMAHMVTSCVGCGLCESACPSHLPVTALFRTVGHKIQQMFQYVPGRDINEVPPVATFKEDELKIESGAL